MHARACLPQLRQLLASTAHGRSTLVLVEGKAGTGKTWFAQSLLALPECRRVPCLIVRFTASTSPVLVPWESTRPQAGPTVTSSQAAARLGTDGRDSAPRAAGGNQVIPPSVATSSGELEELFNSGAATVLVAEDVHQADEQAQALLRRLLACPAAGLCVVLTYRPEELPVPGLVLGPGLDYSAELAVLQVRLGPLSEAEVHDLAVEALGEARCSVAFISRLHQLSGGVVQVVSDILRKLDHACDRAGVKPATDSRAPGQEPLTARDLDRLAAPVRLAELIRGRTATLDRQRQRIVWAAAVLDGPAAEEELASVADLSAGCGQAALLAALHNAALDELGPDRYGFQVPMAAAAVSELIPGPIRRELHRRAAEMLARRQPVPWADLGRHQLASGQLSAWLESVEAAAREAAESGDHRRAITLLEEALAGPAIPLTTRSRLALALARSAVFDLRFDRTVEVLRRVVDDPALPASVRGEIRLDLGLLLINLAGNRSELLKAVEELRNRPALAARAMAALATVRWPGGSLAESLAWLTRAAAAAQESGDPVIQAAVAANRAHTLVSVGDPEAWGAVDQLPRDSTELGCRQHAARGLCNVADAAVWLGEYACAAKLLAEGLELAVKTGVSLAAQNARGIALLLDCVTGRWAGLLARARALVTDESRDPVVVDAYLVLAVLSFARGELGEANAWLAGTGTLYGDEGCIPLAAAASGVRIRLALARADMDAAAREASRAWTRVRALGVWTWAAELAPWAVTACVRAGGREAAQQMVAEFAAGLEGRQAPTAMAALTWCQAVLAEADGKTAAAADQYRRSRARYQDLPRPYEAALTAEGAGHCLLAADPASSAGIADLTCAAYELETLGAAWDAARARAALRAHQPGERRPPGRPGYGEQLSPREKEVATLAAAGLTNREIAATLHLSPRTVEQHVARTMRKLGAASRKDLGRIQLQQADQHSAAAS